MSVSEFFGGVFATELCCVWLQVKMKSELANNPKYKTVWDTSLLEKPYI